MATLHRPSNVDYLDPLKTIVDALQELCSKLPVIFPVHPRTQKMLKKFNLWDKVKKIEKLHIINPLSYRTFMSLVLNAKLVLTDSGGIQEETTYLGIPCLTLRNNTERPITVTVGTNQLVAPWEISKFADDILNGNWEKGKCPKFWDGHTAARILRSLEHRFKDCA